ncbi:hypothetical protein IPM62_00570 [Candidatus Woesebacteria bacterium]|nr:MAG: hypothetical protein IPM62_00570 [Candidatus Woesebacteria bacterium]
MEKENVKLEKPVEQEDDIKRVIVETPNEKSLYKWRGSARAFKKRDRDFWVSVIAIASVTGFILFIIEGIISVILIISILFLYYVLSTVEPGEIDYEITNKSIIIAGEKNPLENFIWFWFGQSLGNEVLVLGSVNMPGRLDLVYKLEDKEKLRKVLSPYLPELTDSPTRTDKATEWLSKKIPANK